MLALWLGTGAVHAQTASPATPSAAPQRVAPAQLSEPERTRLRDLYAKLRPAVLRLEDCPPNDCSVPNSVGTAFHLGDGYVLTAYNLIFGAENLTVLTLDKKRYPVEVIGYDDLADLALLHVNLPASTPSLSLAAARPAIGDAMLSIGNGGGDFLTLKTGRVTALNVQSDRADFPSGMLELDTQIMPGDGGAPIITAQGEVVGVMSYLRKKGGQGSRSTAYAVPVAQDNARLTDLRRGVKRDAPTIGVYLNRPLELAEAYALPAEKFVEFSEHFNPDLGSTPGAFFTDVAPGSPAARAGLQPLQIDRNGKRTAGDIVTAVNGQRVMNFSDFDFAIHRYQPGETVTLTVLRAGKPLEVKLTLVGRSQVGH